MLHLDHAVGYYTSHVSHLTLGSPGMHWMYVWHTHETVPFFVSSASVYGVYRLDAENSDKG